MASRIAATLCALGGALALLMSSLPAVAQQAPGSRPSTTASPKATKPAAKPATAKETVLGSWLVGRWAAYRWADRADPAARRDGTIEFRANRSMVMSDGDGSSSEGSLRYTLDPSHTPAWLDLTDVSEPGDPVPGLLERIDDNTARFASFQHARSHPTRFGPTQFDALLRRLGRDGKELNSAHGVAGALGRLVGVWDVVPWEYRDRNIKRGAMIVEIRADGTFLQRGDGFFMLKSAPEPSNFNTRRRIEGRVRVESRPGPDWIDLWASMDSVFGLFEQRGDDLVKLELFLTPNLLLDSDLVDGRPPRFSDEAERFSPPTMFIYQLERRSEQPEEPAAAIESPPAAEPALAPRVAPTPPSAGLFDAAGLELVRLGPPISGSRTCDAQPFYEPDGNALIFSRSDAGSGKGLGFFRSERTATGWGTPVPYDVPKGVVSPSLSADGQSLYFHSRAPGDAFGGTSSDLFVARRSDGRWGAPENLGRTVNSPVHDTDPTLSRDGRTLVFSSSREGGLGYGDLYVATRDAAGAWTPPTNMGPGVNTAGEEGGPHLSADGRMVIFGAVGDRPHLELFVSTFDGRRWGPRQALSPMVREAVGSEYTLALAPVGNEAVFVASKGAFTSDCSDLFMLRRGASPARRAWRIDYQNETGRWTGDLALQQSSGAWTGRIRFDQQGQWEELREVSVTPQGLRFVRGDQVYRGRFLAGGKVAGTFTWSGREWDWAGQEVQDK